MPRIALTFGAFSGIGPELAVWLLLAPGNLAQSQISALASRAELARAAETPGVTISVGDEPGTGHVHLVGSSRQDIEVPAQVASINAA